MNGFGKYIFLILLVIIPSAIITFFATRSLFGIIRTFLQEKQMIPIPTLSQQQKSKSLQVRASIPYWNQERAIASFKKNVQVFDTLSVFWYFVEGGGDIKKYRDAKEDESFIDFAHSKGVQVSAVITNLPEDSGSSWDSERIENILQSKDSRQQHIEDILNLLVERNFDGVAIDYEEIKANQKDKFSAFIRELSDALHRKGKYVEVALHPKSGDANPRENNGSWAQDWKKLGESADYLYIMAYGEHWNESSAGPIASYDWVKKIVEYAQKINVPGEKMVLGIPLYGTSWRIDNDDPGTGLTYTDIAKILKEQDVTPDWDQKSRTPYISYEDDGEYKVWFENARSAALKVTLAKNSGFGGVTFWRLGGEDPEVWEQVKRVK